MTRQAIQALRLAMNLLLVVAIIGAVIWLTSSDEAAKPKKAEQSSDLMSADRGGSQYSGH